MPGFDIPTVQDNPDGWGPVVATTDRLREIPFAFFKKDDRLGRAADWTGQTFQTRFPVSKPAQSSGTAAAAPQAAREEEDAFRLVDNTRTLRSQAFGRGRRFVPRGAWQQQFAQQGSQQQGAGAGKWGAAGRGRGQQQGGKFRRGGGSVGPFNQGRGGWGRDRQQRPRQSHLDVRPDWEVVEQINFSQLTKLAVENEPEPEDLKTCGSLEYWNKDYDRINPKVPKSLDTDTGRSFYKVSTTDDPIIRDLANEGVGNVFATDAILSMLMACPRSVYPWDIVVQRVGEDKLFLDKRDSSQFDFLTVNETSVEPPMDDPDNINGVNSLSQEATYINQNFSQQVLKHGKTLDFGPNPFATEGDVVAPVAYKYRKWELADNISLVARCEIDAVLEGKGTDEGDLMLTVKALNEYDPKMSGDWRRRLDTQRGAVLATEMKNNSNKLAKWTAQAILAGTDQLKLGYVSRAHHKDNARHVVLGTQFYKPREFAVQMNLNTKNMWGIVRALTDLCLRLDEGKYVLLKDANKQIVRLYSVPDDTFAEAGDADNGLGEAENDEEEGLLDM